MKLLWKRIVCIFKGHYLFYDGSIITERIGRYCCRDCDKVFYGAFIDCPEMHNKRPG